jgi:hypothetical protein
MMRAGRESESEATVESRESSVDRSARRAIPSDYGMCRVELYIRAPVP